MNITRIRSNRYVAKSYTILEYTVGKNQWYRKQMVFFFGAETGLWNVL